MTYWIQRGKTFEAEAVSKGWDHADEPALSELIADLRFSSVLEVGCGFGRIGQGIIERWPTVKYTGLDLSPDLVEAARKRLPGQELICADLATWIPGRRWDLVLAVSVLSHLRSVQVERVIGRLRRAARQDLIVLDWDAVGASTPYQWGHDFRRLLAPIHCSKPIGALTLWHVT